MDHSEPDPNNNGQGPLDESNGSSRQRQLRRLDPQQQQQQSVLTGQQSVVGSPQPGIPTNITIDLATFQAMQQQGLLMQVPGSGQLISITNPNLNQQMGGGTFQLPAAALNSSQPFIMPTIQQQQQQQQQQQGVSPFSSAHQSMLQQFGAGADFTNQRASVFGASLQNLQQQQQQQQQQTNPILSFQSPTNTITTTAAAINNTGNTQQGAGLAANQPSVMSAAAPIASLQLADLERIFGQQVAVAAAAAASQQQSPQLVLTVHPVEGGGQPQLSITSLPLPFSGSASNAITPVPALSQGGLAQASMLSIGQQQQQSQTQFDPQTNSLWMPTAGGGGTAAGLVAAMAVGGGGLVGDGTAGGAGFLDGGSNRPSKRQRLSQGRVYPLYLTSDEQNLSRYQCLARKQIEIFETTDNDAGSNAQGRNRPIIPGQVGIRCKHCAHLPRKERKTGSVYYPSKVIGIMMLNAREMGEFYNAFVNRE